MTDLNLTVARIVALVGGTLEGDGSGRIQGLAPLDVAGAADVTFATDSKRLAGLLACKAGAVIVAGDAQVGVAAMPLIRVDNVRAAVAKLLAHMAKPEDAPPVGIDPSAHVAPDAQIAADVRIGPGAVVAARSKIAAGCVLCANVSIGSDVEIGPGTVLRENVVVWQGCRIGSRVRIGPNAVIGYDGFGFDFVQGKHQKVPHVGNVVIEDDVEIGACSCVDRAKFGSTRIGAGTKIDNLVQVAHNVQVGRGCLFAAFVGIAGSTKLGNYVALGGHSGATDNLTIGDGVVCGACSVIFSDTAPNQMLLGVPAIPRTQRHRQTVYASKLGDLFGKVREMEKRIEALELPEDH